MRSTARGILLAAVLLGACSGDDDGTDPTGPDLSGNYTLVSYTLGGVTLTPPAATGTLTLTATTYTVSITVVGQGTTNDNGTYSVSGNQITQTSNVNPIQTVGTWSQSGNQFTIDVTVPTIGRLISVWQKQS